MVSANLTTPVEHRVIPDFPDYKVGDDGSVWSCSVSRIYGRPDKWIRLKPRPMKGGYVTVALYHNKKRTDRLVHRIVLETFVGACPDGMEACHADHDPSNNRLDNLSWGTHQENVQQSVDVGRISAILPGESHAQSKLTEDDIREIRRLAIEGVGHAELARRFGVKRGYISTVARFRSWKHLGDEDMAKVDAALRANRWKNIRASNSKLTADQVREIRRLLGDGSSTNSVAKQFGVAGATIYAIKHRMNWKDI